MSIAPSPQFQSKKKRKYATYQLNVSEIKFLKDIFKHDMGQLTKTTVLARRIDNEEYEEFFTGVVNSENITADIFAEQILRIISK